MHPTPSTSASPAPHRASSLVRHTDGPSKRRQFGPRSPASNASSFSRNSVSPADSQRDASRRASSTRVLTVWSTLENKYLRRLDEDDIWDLSTDGLIKDIGAISGGAARPLGYFMDTDEVEVGSARPVGEDDNDDDSDEIGGWGSESEHGYINDPPVREPDPKDAEDLRAFLASEESMRKKYGVEEDLGLPEPHDGQAYVEYSLGETDGSVIEVEAESPLAISNAESDDELDGYDETVGEGALLWEVGTRLDNCSEPLGIEAHCTTPKAVPTLAFRNITPTQLRTPPLSRSSGISSHMASFPSRRPPVNLSLSSPARHQSNLTTSGTTSKKGKQRESRSPETPIDALQSKWKGLKREGSVSPTKKLIPEVFIPSFRCGRRVFNQDVPADQDEPPPPPRSRGRTPSASNCPDNNAATKQASNHGPSMSSKSQPHRRHSMPSALSDAQVVNIVDQVTDVSEPVGRFEGRAPASPRRNVKRKCVLSGDTNMGDDRIPRSRTFEDSGEDDNATLPEAFAAPARCRRSSTTILRSRRTTTSSPAERPRLPSSSRHRDASAVPPGSLDFWNPDQHRVSAASPSSMPYPSHLAAPEPILESQVYMARVMQSLTYLAFGLRPPAPAFSHPRQPPVPAPPSHHPSTPTSPRPYAGWPYFHPSASHPHPHPHPQGPVWPYPQSPSPYSSVAHFQHNMHASSSSSPFPPFTSRSGDDPPSSPRELFSSPTPSPKKRKGKRVSFSDEDPDETANTQAKASRRIKDTAAPGQGSESVSDSNLRRRQAQNGAVRRRVRKKKGA